MGAVDPEEKGGGGVKAIKRGNIKIFIFQSEKNVYKTQLIFEIF